MRERDVVPLYSHAVQTIPFEEVERTRTRIHKAREVAAQRFREAFANTSAEIPPNERWNVHLQIQATALLEAAELVRLVPDHTIHYEVDSRLVTPYAVDSSGERHLLHTRLETKQTPAALLELWLVISELLASPNWAVTRLVASHEEYNEALARMKSPQLVRPLFLDSAPAAEWHDDGTAMLEVTVYSRAGEERIERRHLALDQAGEFHFHSRDLLAEGTGGISV